MAGSEHDPPASVLVYVGRDRLGDGLMKLPFVQALRTCYPDAHVTWLAGKGPTVMADVLRPLTAGAIDEVIAAAGIGSRLAELARRPLPGRAFDLLIDTQTRVKTALLVRRIAHRRFVTAAAGGLLSAARAPGRPRRGGALPRHLSARLLALLSLARHGRPDRVEAPAEPLAVPADRAAAARALLPAGPAYVALAPGAGWEVKRWPLERFVDLARRQAGRGRVPVVLLGPGERGWEESLRAALPEARFPLGGAAAPPGDPALTVALAGRCAAGVANDSGAGHLLAAARLPLVSLFGPTEPERFAPLTRPLAIVRAADHGADVMDAIPLEAVEAALERLLAAAPAAAAD